MATLLAAFPVVAMDLTVDGTWSLAVTSDDFIGGPGSELQSTYESQPGQVLLGISRTGGISSKWRLDVRSANAKWPGPLRLFVRVADLGIGSGLINGSESYQEIEGADHAILSGSGDRNAIAVVFKLTGMSLGVAPGTYSTNVIFTLADVQ